MATIYKQIYNDAPMKKMLKYADIFLNISILGVILLIFLFYSLFADINFFSLFAGADFLWSAFAIFSYIIGIQVARPNIKITGYYIFILCYCWIACFLVFGFYLLFKMALAHHMQSWSVFVAGLLSYISAIGCNILAKRYNIIE